PPSGLPRADILRQRWMAVMMARKKGSTRRGARVVRRDFARDEIVEEVVENLRPWKNHKSRDSVTAAVNQQLDVLVKLAPLQAELFDARQYRGHAKKLDKALSNVEKLLKAAPAMLAVSLFNPLPPLELTDDDEYPLVQPMPHKSIEEIERAHQVRANRFVTELRRLRKICAVKPGTHPNYDHAKHLSA